MINEYQKRLMAEGFLLRLASLTNEQERVALVVELMNEMAPKGLPSTVPIFTRDLNLPNTTPLDSHYWCNSNVENIND